MKKSRESFSGFSIIGFFLFFITIGLTSTCSIFVYYLANKSSNGNEVVITFSVLLTILIGSIICSAFDIIRRKKMIDKPVKMILNATEKIALGNFDVKLLPLHEYLKYDEYDLIFENINAMANELSKNEMLKNDFISNVSHEIKTPLANLQNYAKILQNDNLDKLKRQEYLQNMVIQTKKLSDLISNILKLNKLENQQIVQEIKEIDLSELLRVSVLNFENLIENKNIDLQCNIDEVKIVSSASLLEIAFNNLISNAIKFTDCGGKIEVNLKDNAPDVIIEIKDNGCGISDEIGKHIFDKFYQGDTSHSSEGNGLGLALVKKVIDLIGGEIFVKSKVNVGSTFTIKLKK